MLSMRERLTKFWLSLQDIEWMYVAGLQEKKWFGSGVYRVDDSLVVAAGRAVPGAGVVNQRGEGVAVVLCGPAVDTWRSGVDRWKMWRSRLVTVALKVGQDSPDVVHVVSWYAPTFAASREETDSFYGRLQEVLSSITSQECYVLLGDFNAQVGSRSECNDKWRDERSPYRHCVLNGAGS